MEHDDDRIGAHPGGAVRVSGRAGAWIREPANDVGLDP